MKSRAMTHMSSRFKEEMIIGNATISSYPNNFSAISLAMIKVNGRHPENVGGYFIETALHMVFYVVSGKGCFIVDGKKYRVSSGDEIFIKPNQYYCVSGNLSYLVACNPRYYPEQNKLITND